MIRWLFALVLFTLPLEAQVLEVTHRSLHYTIPGNFEDQIEVDKGNGREFVQRSYYDASDNETRGNILGVEPGQVVTVYWPAGELTRRTWDERPTIGAASAIQSSGSPLIITEGGTPEAKRLYDGTGATIDVGTSTPHAVEIRVPHVELRNLTIRGGTSHAVLIAEGVSDVLTHGNDIANWGPFEMNFKGGHAGIGIPRGGGRIVIERNEIHDPNGGALSWRNGHPGGPRGIHMKDPAGNNVIRYNEFYSSEGHYFQDAIGGGTDGSDFGVPGENSAVYGNYVANAWDDGTQLEGGGKNVVVFGNFYEHNFVHLAIAPVTKGPLDAMWNVFGQSRHYHDTDDSDQYGRGPAVKAGEMTVQGRGRVHFFNNTVLQSDPAPGKTEKLGPRGMYYGSGGEIYNLRSGYNLGQGSQANARIYTKANHDNVIDNDVGVGRWGDVPAGTNANGELRSSHIPVAVDFDGTKATFTADVPDDVGVGSREWEYGVLAYLEPDPPPPPDSTWAVLVEPIDGETYVRRMRILVHATTDADTARVRLGQRTTLVLPLFPIDGTTMAGVGHYVAYGRTEELRVRTRVEGNQTITLPDIFVTVKGSFDHQ